MIDQKVWTVNVVVIAANAKCATLMSDKRKRDREKTETYEETETKRNKNF
jgi:hypothetical protein